MQMNSSSGDAGSIAINIFFWSLILGYLLYSIVRKRRAVSAQDGPVLSSGEMLGAGGLQSMNKGSIAGFEYNLLTNNTGRVMFFVELGHNSWSHIIAHGDKSLLGSGAAPQIARKWLEPVSLEGDFPDYFHMLCNPEAQTTIREVFAPDVMAQFADFCRAYDFELFHDTLYLSLAQNAVDADDQTTLTTDVTDFLEHNAEVLRRL
jgi:hypothetical protein